MTLYILIAVLVTKSGNNANIGLEAIPFKELAVCEKVATKLRSDFEKKYDQVTITCQPREVR